MASSIIDYLEFKQFVAGYLFQDEAKNLNEIKNILDTYSLNVDLHGKTEFDTWAKGSKGKHRN